MLPNDLSTALAKEIDPTLAAQLIEEARSLEESFLLRRWKYTELDGGRFAEVSARIVYHADSGNLSLTKSVDDCLKYVDNGQVAHNFPEKQAAIHFAKVIRSIYKLRSQRGAVHVSPTYTANEIDSRLIIESARWVLAEFIRIFIKSKPEEVASAIRNLARFPQPLIRTYVDTPLLQSISFTAEEEVLAHLLYAEEGLATNDLTTRIPKDASGIRRALGKLSSGKYRQIVTRSSRWYITDLGINRIEEKIANEVAP
ncbi:hypothetical protein VSH64_48350 [Amycolatopsis rhabdoformis]|uniref:Uncharacterized protein n=1 Tax=Amycolatopsis rhabdoformis TaxID=1448059 RepID=A0ABZ1I8L3_9PSEU|nr:hypothetical protein [Amycolatopsis rhabdoformis]WSE30519.1 hypothetical protein VSH64_48350 [Amycolatopsis rhabdoformis]